MSSKKKIKQAIYTIVFMVIITAICSAGVAYTYHNTLKQIKMNEEMYLKKAVLEAAGIQTDNLDSEKIASVYDENVKKKESNGKVWYVLKNGDFVFPVTGTGLWGKIDGVVGLKKDLKTLTGVSFINNNETPGLGARITEKWFGLQFNGKQGPVTFVAEGTNGNINQFDAITGATITTTAVKNMVNSTLETAHSTVGKVK